MKNGQQHIVNFITENGDIGAEFGDDQPLDEARMHTLTVNGIQLLHHADLNHAFITELANAGCIM